jgi:hypothetical protein
VKRIRYVMVISGLVMTVLVVLLFAVWTYVGYAATSDIETPKYEVVKTADVYEIRLYAPQIRAEVVVEGSYRESLYGGFRKLADYIFGNNTAQSKIDMTAPVLSERSEKIAMTAPVLHEPQEGKAAQVVAFVMPSSYTLETLPKPNNEEVLLRQVPATRYAVHSFSGWATEGRVVSRTKALQEALARDGVKTVGAPMTAQYDPPWTPPYMRQNEILIALE